MALIGDDHVARIDVLGLHAELAEGQRDNVTGQTFAVAGNGVDGARRQLAQHRQALHQLGELLKVFVERAVQLRAVLERHHQARLPRVVIAKVVDLADVLRAIPLNRGSRDGQQFVGGLSHGGNHHHRAALRARLDDTGNALNSGSRFHRGAAELHHDHQSSIPSECISSAFKTAAPAAPRIVL